MKNLLLAASLLLLASCGEQHRAQGLVKDFLDENLTESDCDFERFTPIGRTAMIDSARVRLMHREVERLPFVRKGIKYDNNALPDTLLYIRATYKLTDKAGKSQQYTQTFYMDKELSRIIAFKEN